MLISSADVAQPSVGGQPRVSGMVAVASETVTIECGHLGEQERVRVDRVAAGGRSPPPTCAVPAVARRTIT